MTNPNLTPPKIRQFAEEFQQPEVMEKIIEATRGVLGKDVPYEVVGAYLQTAAGYNYTMVTKNRSASLGIQMATLLGFNTGMKLAPCQCKKCNANRDTAKASVDAMLKKAARK